MTGAARKRASPERDFQRAAVVWLKRVLPGCVVMAIPNEQRGAGRTAVQRMRFGAARKASGVLSGAPDLLLVMDQRVIFIELKAPGGVLSETQQCIHERLCSLGHCVMVADSIESLRLELHQAGITTCEAPGQPMQAPKVRRAKRLLTNDPPPFSDPCLIGQD